MGSQCAVFGLLPVSLLNGNDPVFAVAALLLLGAVLLVFWIEWRMRQHHGAAEQQFRTLMDAAPLAIAITRRDNGKFLFVNQATIKLLGLSPTGYHAQNILYADPSRDRAHLLEAIRQHGRVVHHEAVMSTYDGRSFPFVASVAPIRFDGIDALFGSFDDISAVKEAEQQIRTSEARLRAVFEAAPDGILIIDHSGIIRQVSASLASLVGHEASADLTGKTVWDFIPASDRETIQQLVQNTAQGEPFEAPPVQIPRPDGSALWIEPRAVRLLDPITHQTSIVIVLRNITQRMEARHALTKRAAELQEALNRIAHLQNEIVRVCAWTKEVNVDGEWIPIDHYLAKHLGLKVSHGISEKGLEMLGLPPEEPPEDASAHPPPPPPPLTPPAASP